MSASRIASFYYPTKEEVADQFLRRVRIGAERAGHTVNVAVGSELWLRGQALAGILCHVFANNKIALQKYGPTTATGDDLVEQAAMRGVEPRPGAKAQGEVVARASAIVTVPEGFPLTAPSGIKLEVTEDTNVTPPSSNVPVRALVAGTAGNLDALTTVTFDNASIGFLQRTAVIASPGLTGGTEDEDEEELRGRYLEKLRVPPHGWALARDLAYAATASVDRAYVYPCCRGPGTMDVCVIGEDATVLNDQVCDEVAAYIQDEDGGTGRIGPQTDLVVTSARPEYLDLVVEVATRDGEWEDATPWPTEPVRVTAQAGAVLTTSAAFADAPADGARIAIIVDGTPTSYVVQSSADAGGFLELTLGEAPPDAVGAYLSADSDDLTSYAAAVLTAMSLLGPGEKTDNTNLLPRAQRRPTPSAEDPTTIGSAIVAPLVEAHPEVEFARFVASYATGTTTERRSPSLPAAVGDAPRLLKCQHLAFVAAA